MGTGYWDYETTATTGTSTTSWFQDNGTATTTTADYVSYVTYERRPRKLLVRSPKHWSERDHAAFVKLINKDTNTGWIVEMIIPCDVLITDHSIEVVSMLSFVDILRARATANDNEKITRFFVDRGAEDRE